MCKINKIINKITMTDRFSFNEKNKFSFNTINTSLSIKTTFRLKSNLPTIEIELTSLP